MKTLVLTIALAMFGCSNATDPHPTTFGPFALTSVSPSFAEQQQKLIEAHRLMLVKSGHMGADFGMAYMYLGVYGWYNDGKERYFGAYAFSQAAYEQAQRAWFGHFHVIEGNDELWQNDDNLKFDSSAIGLMVPPMSMIYFKDGGYKSEYFTAKIVGIKDDGKTLLLDKRAPHHAEQYQMIIASADWQDMCNCHGQFHPPMSGQDSPANPQGEPK